jgi:SAM-dependent methyltransferase
VTGDRERWDRRHAHERERAVAAPDPFVKSVLGELGDAKGRSALDLASGVGRHSSCLAALGYQVSAWDVSPVALEILSQRARGSGLFVATREVDLMHEPVFEQRFDLIVCVDFLSRPLFQALHRGVVPGGSVIVTTFSVDFPGTHPSARFRLERGELTALPELLTQRAVEIEGRAGIWALRRR